MFPGTRNTNTIPNSVEGVNTKRKLSIGPGPNNPVGLVWIDLTDPTYGIHGTPGPSDIGKAQSHGCIRLTNWDAEAAFLAIA